MRGVFYMVSEELGVLHVVIFPTGISTPDRSEVMRYGLHLNNLPALTLSVHHAK